MTRNIENKEEIRKIRAWEKGFPERILEQKGMPKELYYIGSLPSEAPAVAIVGARSCTPYGREKAIELGKFCAQHGIAVISGMAEGIDGYAHEGALLGGGKTYAVLGCGPDICYPKRHVGLRKAILGSGGGILTEYPPGSEPLAWRFPARNRIISALADIVVVVEARKRSGSLITADFALEQGKTVLAFPGRQGDRLSEGTNALIAQGAGIIASYDTVLWELAQCGRYAADTSPGTEERGQTDNDETCSCASSEEKDTPFGAGKEMSGLKAVLAEQIGYDPVSAEELLPLAEGSLPALQCALLDLMLDGEVEELSSGIYVKKVSM